MSDPSNPGDTPETDIFESDPNADSADGLAGGMGVSSERRGEVRGGDHDVTYGASPTHPDAGAEPEAEGASTGEDTPPEQSGDDGEPEVHPANDVTKHPFDRDRNPGHTGG